MSTRADCTVRALSTVAGITYEAADHIAAAAGRKPGRRFSSLKLVEQAKSHGIRLVKLRMRPRTLARFINERPIGRYYAAKRGHAFAVINGCVDDARVTAHTRIVVAWRLVQA